MTRRLYLNISLLCLVTICNSCAFFEQGGQTTVEGIVVDSGTGQPVGAAQVSLYKNRRSSSSSALTQEGNWRTTDAQGRFSFSFDADAKIDYFLRATSVRGETGYLSAPRLKGGRKNKDVRVPVTAPAWVGIHLVDVPPTTDAVNVWVWGLYEPFVLFPPQNQDTVIYRFVKPAASTSIVWQLNGSRLVPDTEQRITYSVASMDTARVDIRY